MGAPTSQSTRSSLEAQNGYPYFSDFSAPSHDLFVHRQLLHTLIKVPSFLPSRTISIFREIQHPQCNHTFINLPHSFTDDFPPLFHKLRYAIFLYTYGCSINRLRSRPSLRHFMALSTNLSRLLPSSHFMLLFCHDNSILGL